MQLTNKTICPLCGGEVPSIATWCGHCGRNLPPMKHAHKFYEIISDGSRFRVVLRYEGKIDRLALENARIILSVLNSMN